MSIRLLSGTIDNPHPNVYVPHVEQYCTGGCVHIVPSTQSGTPAANYALTIGRASDWTTADADANITTFFEAPGSVVTVSDFHDYMVSHTIADISASKRTAIQNYLTNHGVDWSDFTMATTWAAVLKRVISRLLEKDYALGRGLTFV